MVDYNRNEEPVILSKAVLDLLLTQEKPTNLISLYTFYYYTAKWQKTNQCKCTTKYIMNGLNLSEAVVLKNKKILLELGLIKKIVVKNSSGKIKGHYIQLCFIWTKENSDVVEKQQKTRTCILQDMEKEGTNALSTNNKYMSDLSGSDEDIISFSGSNRRRPIRKTESKSKEIIPIEKTNPPELSKKEKENKIIKRYSKFSNQLSDIIKTKKRVKHTTTQINSWNIHFRKLHKQNEIEISRIKRALGWYADNIGEPFVPEPESGKTFREKFIQLESAMVRAGVDLNIKQKTKRKTREDYEREEAQERKRNRMGMLSY